MLWCYVVMLHNIISICVLMIATFLSLAKACLPNTSLSWTNTPHCYWCGIEYLSLKQSHPSGSSYAPCPKEWHHPCLGFPMWCDEHSPVPSSFQSQHRVLYYSASPHPLQSLGHGGPRSWLSLLTASFSSSSAFVRVGAKGPVIPQLLVCSCLLSWSVLQQQKSNQHTIRPY